LEGGAADCFRCLEREREALANEVREPRKAIEAVVRQIGK
jgi:hypothetical protein